VRTEGRSNTYFCLNQPSCERNIPSQLKKVFTIKPDLASETRGKFWNKTRGGPGQQAFKQAGEMGLFNLEKRRFRKEVGKYLM